MGIRERSRRTLEHGALAHREGCVCVCVCGGRIVPGGLCEYMHSIVRILTVAVYAGELRMAHSPCPSLTGKHPTAPSPPECRGLCAHKSSLHPVRYASFP